MRDWEALVPRGVAIQQTAWELNQRVLRAFEAGMTRKEIGVWLGVSGQMANIRLLWATGRKSRISPVERYLSGGAPYGFTRRAAKLTIPMLS